MKTQFEQSLMPSQKLHVQQVIEGFEIALGFETRNKYRIFDEDMKPLAYAAEEKTGIMGSLARLYLKHWRTFTINIYGTNREMIFKAHFPFRWFFKHLYLNDTNGVRIGHLDQRFAFFHKVFDIFDANNQLIGQIKSPIFKPWTFEVKDHHQKLGTIQKKWSGALTELFTDKDNFVVSYAQPDLSFETKTLMMATCFMIDIVYFENNNRR